MANFSSHYGQTSSFRSTETRYNGLRNQGATCYLNSVLQSLYMTEDLREQVEDFKPDSSNVHMKHSQSNDLMTELKNLFKKMKKSNGTTHGITESLHISNVYKQQDAVEYYQKILKAIDPQASKVFEGVMNNKTNCSRNHTSHEKHNFFTIPLAIEAGHSEVFNMVKGLQTFFNKVKLDEDNWLYCKDCGEKTETETWNDMEVFPTILTLYLKRFYFDYNQMRPVKNHCSIHISPKLEINNIGYSLYAVINHTGDERGGHYNVFINSFEDGEWYCFDDLSVTNVSDNFSLNSKTAFLLMYKKLDRLDSEKSTHELRCATKSEQHVKVTGDNYLDYVSSLKEIWLNLSRQVDLYLQEVEHVAMQMQPYRQHYDQLIHWTAEAKKWLEIQFKAMTVSDNKMLAQGKDFVFCDSDQNILKEIENQIYKVEKLKNYASANLNLAKEHESQLPAFKALVEFFSFNKVESLSDSIRKEIEALDKHYGEMLRLKSKYINLQMSNQPEDNEEQCCATEFEKHVQVTGGDCLLYAGRLKELWPYLSRQVYNFLQKLNHVAKQMQAYRQHYDWLIQRIARAKKLFENIKAMTIIDIKQLSQWKKLFEQLQNKECKLEKCKNYASAYLDLAKEHECQLPAWKVESHSDSIKKEVDNLHELYDEVLTMWTSEYINLKIEKQPDDNEVELAEPRNFSDKEFKCKSQQVQKAPLSRNKIEEDKIAQVPSEKQGHTANKETQEKWKAEEKLKQKSAKEQEGIKQTNKAKEDIETFKQKAKEQNHAPEAKAAKHAKVQENTEKLRDIHNTESKNEFLLPNDVALQSTLSTITTESQSGDLTDPAYDEKSFSTHPLKKCKIDKEKISLVQGHRNQVNWEQLKKSQIIDQKVYTKLVNGSISVGDLSKDLKKYLGANCIAGVYAEDTKERLPIYQAMKKNKIGQDDAIELLKAQAVTGYVIDPINNQKLTVNEAIKMEVVGSELKDLLLSTKQAVTGYIFLNQNTGENLTYHQLLERCMIDRETGLALLLLKEKKHERNTASNLSVCKFIAAGEQKWKNEMGPIAGILFTDTLEKLPVIEAINRKIVDRIFGQRLLEAQACTGGIIDPNTGEKFTVKDAVDKGLVEDKMKASLNIAQKAFQGYKDSKTQAKMSVYQASNENRLHYEPCRRFLEVQYLTGGLIEPDVASRLSLDDAVKKGIVDANTAQKLQNVNEYFKYLKCPRTGLNISYKDAMEKSLIDERSGLCFLEV